MKIVDIGYETNIDADEVLFFTTPDSTPTKRKIKEAYDRLRCLDVTRGRTRRSVIFMKNGYVLLCALQVKTLKQRLMSKENDENYKE